MVAQGMDSLSRGVLTEGVMEGVPVASFIPLHLDAYHRSPGLVPWIQSWVPHLGLQPLSVDDWFFRGQGLAGFLVNIDGRLIRQEGMEQLML